MCAHSQITILRIRLCRLLYIVGTQHSERNLENLEKLEIKKILKFYKSIYPNSKIAITQDTIETWMMMFGEYSYEQVQKAIVKFSKSNKYIPNLAEIISNIDGDIYSVEKIKPNTVIIQYEDDGFGNFPFRFSNSQEAREYSKNSKTATTIRKWSKSYMMNMLENVMMVFLHTGEKRKQD